MGRKPKCTVEEKISAVEDYLNGIRSVSEIMVDLSIKSTRTIRNWILAYQNGGIEALCSVTANHSYSSEFKIEMVRKYINGEGSVTDLCARYGIPSHATLQKWISLYNANRELRDYDSKREVYMAEARRKTTLEERKEIVDYCISKNIPVMPGIVTPSELAQAVKRGLTRVKFFPATAAGGIKMIKAMCAAYTTVRIMPTGGINTSNLEEFLSCDKIFCCGGSWMVKGDMIKAGEFDKIKDMTAEAVALVKKIRG